MAHVILITRPQPAASRLAERLRARPGPCVPVVVSPLMRIETMPRALPDPTGYAALVVTSANALSALRGRDDIRGKPCYCVGAATARAATSMGLAALDAGGTAEQLQASILARPRPGRLLYLRGEHVASDLAAELSRAGAPTDEAIVYAQAAQPLTEEAKALLSENMPIILPLFSARSARLFFDQANGSAPLYVAAMSLRTAGSVPPGAAEIVTLAETPTESSMLDAISALESRLIRVESGSSAQ